MFPKFAKLFSIFSFRSESTTTAVFFRFVTSSSIPVPFASAVTIVFASAVFGASNERLSTKIISLSFNFFERVIASAFAFKFLLIFFE